ncbi:MAG TPA: PEP-CTERM sorting domain-containing protein [Candidatus Paceibacterota bacterium]|nr:PEP-CTERM sorting domain-containing protein [Candidatus Paceibacterota bacterium]
MLKFRLLTAAAAGILLASAITSIPANAGITYLTYGVEATGPDASLEATIITRSTDNIIIGFVGSFELTSLGFSENFIPLAPGTFGNDNTFAAGSFDSQGAGFFDFGEDWNVSCQSSGQCFVAGQFEPFPFPVNVTTTLLGTQYGGNAIPEPSTWEMMIVGFAGLGFAGYRRARALPVRV